MSLKKKEAGLGWSLISIYLLYTAIFWGYPFVWMLILAFSKWKFVGYYGLILYSGLQAIPKSIYEAAELDGATPWIRFWKITLPLLNPAIVTVLILAVNLSFGIFTEPYMITGGGPMNRTLTFMLYMYNTAFQRINPSYATTIAVMTALINFSIVIFIRKVIEKEVTIV